MRIFAWAVLVGLMVGALIGFIRGIVIGANSAFGETDGSSEMVYASDGSEPIPVYWYVYLNNLKQPTLRSTTQYPLQIESESNYIVNIGPNGIAEVGVPLGNSGFEHASARFLQTEESIEVIVRCTVSDITSDEWPCREYKYTVSENELRLVEIMRSGPPFNEWGGEMVFFVAIETAFFGLFAGGITGGIVGFLIQHSKE